MRINWSEDEDRPGQFDLWQANCRRSLAGKAGQQALRDLEAELLRMPEKRLIGNDLAADGKVCAVGALLRGRGMAQSRLEELSDCGDETDEIATAEGVPRLVAWKLVELNDIELEQRTPERRYEAVLAWVREQTKGGTGGRGNLIQCGKRRAVVTRTAPPNLGAVRRSDGY